MMEKYKLCPGCGTRNAPQDLDCIECGMDLQNEPIRDDEAAAPAPEAPTPGEMIRLCDCGAENPVMARRCTVCGEDISTVAPTPRVAAEAPAEHVLATLDGAYAYRVPEGVTRIGREHAMQAYLRRKPFVSREHAELSLADGVLTLRNLSRTNYTFRNGELLGEEAVPLADGDEIGLGGTAVEGVRQEDAAYFLVRIGPCR